MGMGQLFAIIVDQLLQTWCPRASGPLSNPTGGTILHKFTTRNEIPTMSPKMSNFE